MEEKQIQADLASIRSLMERSSKFISLSGLSGVLAGIYALIGAAVAYYLVYMEYLPARYNVDDTDFAPHRHRITEVVERGNYPIFIDLLLVAFLVLAASLITGYVLTKRKAKRKGQAVWGQISRAMLFYMAVPLISGGIYVLIHVYRLDYEVVASGTLIFYGLSLVSASNFTYTMVKYLGICEIVLGLIAACFPNHGLLFWAIGFGVLHIIYGSVMYLKYDR